MDNKNLTGSPYSKLINTNENYEVEYWSNKFGVSVEKLKSAVRAVGNAVEKVEEYLKK